MKFNYANIEHSSIGNIACQVSGGAEPNEASPGTVVVRDCLGCASGRSCRKCRAGRYDASPFTCLNSVRSGEYLKHKTARFYVRAYRGAGCGYEKGYRFRWFVLTESDEALRGGIKFGSEFHRFIRWLRYYCPDFQYLVVEHRQGMPSVVTEQLRRNWHVLSYGSDKLPLSQMREYWLEHYLSTVTGMAQVRDITRAVGYLAGYLSDSEKYVRCWCSQGWVFRGWIGSCQEYKRAYGSYLSSDELVKLSLMSRAVRDTELGWLLNTGYMSSKYG